MENGICIKKFGEVIPIIKKGEKILYSITQKGEYIIILNDLHKNLHKNDRKIGILNESEFNQHFVSEIDFRDNKINKILE